MEQPRISDFEVTRHMVSSINDVTTLIQPTPFPWELWSSGGRYDPDANSNLPPGNRGTVDIGSPNNSTNDLKRQIVYGVNANDLAFFPNGVLKFNEQGFLYLNGDTGISAGIEASLKSIIGEVRAIPIFIDVSGPGNNAEYTMVKFVGRDESW